MAFLDIFEEQRKKLNNYFGLGQPGLGTFGKQVSNVIKPTVQRNIQNYQKVTRPVQQFTQRQTSQIKPFVQKQTQRPIVQANLHPFTTFKKGYQSQPRMEEMPIIQAMHGTNPYPKLQGEDKLYNKITNWRPKNKVLNVASNFVLGSPEENQKIREAFRTINLKQETPEQRKLARQATENTLLWGVSGGLKPVAKLEQAAADIAKTKSPAVIRNTISKVTGIEANKVGKSLIDDLVNEANSKKVADVLNLLKPKAEKAAQYVTQGIKGAKQGAKTPPVEVLSQKGVTPPLSPKNVQSGVGTSVPPAGKGIERGFSKTIKTAQGLPDEIQNLKSTYTPITNKATLKAAKTQLDVEKFVKTNYDQAKKRVLSGEMTAENNALGQELIRRNIDAGKFDEVDEIFNKMAEKGTSAGQYNQAFAMWSKTTPEGMLKYAKSTVDKANSQLGSVSKALRGVFGKQMPKIDEADAKFITSQMKKAQGLPEAQRIPLIQSVMDRINKKIPWGVSDVIDTYRYNNMLSNPLTHLRNAVSNLQQTFITRPATLLGQGKVKDTVKYEIGTLKALPDAVDGFVKAMKKPGQLGRLDEPMRLKPRLLGRWNTPSDLMEAGDVFFRKLIESGEKSRGTTAKEASEIAEYSLFRAPLNAKQQGVLLNKIDDVTKATYNLRKVGLGWFIPFIRTPMNVAKQWIEYSPAGFSTMVGAGNKGEQAAKATVGSLITLAGANLALQGRTTWDAPVDPKEKELFYASGRKPFSVKVGDKWVPMQTFGAFAFALGLPAAAKYYQTESRTALTDDDISKWTKIATSGLNFWSGQTFVQGLGNFVDLVQGDQDWKLSRLLAQPITQLKPMTGALSYIARLTDPVFRKASGFGDQLKQGVPGLTKGMKAYTNPLGEESRRNITDFVAPYSMGQEDTRFEQPYKERQKTLQENNLINQLKKQGKSGTAPSGRTVVQIGNEFKEFDTEQEANFAIAKEDFKKSGKNIQQYEDKVFRLQSDGDVKVQDKIDYDYSLNTNKLQRLKSSKDYKGWVETANKQLEILDKQLKDPTLDELEQSDLLEKADKILSDMAKYSEYGGFDKPKKGKKINISVPDLGSAKIPVKRAGKFAFKTSSTPKINIVSTKPKQITKSYLASIR